MVLPDHLPTPRGGLLAEFAPAEADELARLFLTGGGGLALLTARSRLEFIRDRVRPLLEAQGLPLLAQGDAPAPALQEQMLDERETSLLALRSFWEGVDLPGEALRLLDIEKLPFDPPNDPVAAARMEDLELRGQDPFNDYLVPQAVLRFTQGVGRLIDRAVAASGTDLTDFVVTNLTVASRRVLADRTAFSLDPESQQAWQRGNRRPARTLSGLRKLMERPSPLTEA